MTEQKTDQTAPEPGPAQPQAESTRPWEEPHADIEPDSKDDLSTGVSTDVTAGHVDAVSAHRHQPEDESDAPRPEETTLGATSVGADQGQVAQQARRPGVFPMVLGGVAAAFLGYGAARTDLIDEFLPPAWRMPEAPASASAPASTPAIVPAIADLRGDVTTLSARMDQMSSRLAALENRPVPVSEPPPDLRPLEMQLQDMTARIAALESRPASLATRPPDPDHAQEFAALQEAAKDQQARIGEIIAQAEQAQATAAAAARIMQAQAALARLYNALASGVSYEDALRDLREAGIADLPLALGEHAQSGVASLGALQGDVASFARAALDAARGAGQGASNVRTFFERQLGMRSLTPRGGDDPDAILSRFEAAVQAGDIAAALREASALPATARDAMGDFLTRLEARDAVMAAIAALEARIAGL